jgi:hypothetical protein
MLLYVIKIKQFTIYLCHVLLQKFYGALLIWLLIFTFHQISQTCLAIGCMGYKRKQNAVLEWVCALLWTSGMSGIILSLTE